METSPDAQHLEESQQTQTQGELTQLTQPDHFTPDESSNLLSISSQTPNSPTPVLPWGRLVPCVASTKLPAVDFVPNRTEYWLGRSHKCDVTARISPTKSMSEKVIDSLEWAKSMISNKHCRIFQNSTGNQVFIEDNSGNGTYINQQTRLRKGETRLLHSGDEICLVNAETLRKKNTSSRVLQAILQQFSYIFVQSKPRKPCVNPRAMNYHKGQSHTKTNPISPRSSRRIEVFYDLREVLGDGTSGQVRRAIHRQTGQEYAVKIISLRRQVDMSMMDREVSLLQKLDHPYITSLVDVFVQPAVAMYIVMELVKGGDLFDQIVEKQRYTEIEARRTMRRLLSAVYYLHEQCNIVHRDLKPENILCSSPTHVKLADFGLAKIVKADGLKTFCGTPAYFAPEVLQRRGTVAGEGRYGKPADVWSLGVILYILLTGRPPFDADIDEIKSHFELDFDSDCSIWASMPMAQELVQHMLRLDPKRRIAVKQACNHPWINVEDGDTHCHPLDDPSVTTKKRLFEEVEENLKNEKQKQKSATLGSEDDEEDGDSTSVLSKDDSVLSKQEFAEAAISRHTRNESVLHFDSQENSDELNEQERGTIANEKTNEEEEIISRVQALQNVDRLNSPSPRDVKKMSIEECKSHDSNYSNNECETPPDEDVANSSSPSEDSLLRSSEYLDVTPSEHADSPPRSPLAKLNLNDRCNRFRDQVMEKVGIKEESQTAVTPTSSNMKRQEQSNQRIREQDAECVEDPILSQFSSEPSSIESFGDTSESSSCKDDSRMKEVAPLETKAVSETVDKKRPVDDDDSNSINGQPSKRPRTSNSKQTTLKAWLVKKEA